MFAAGFAYPFIGSLARMVLLGAVVVVLADLALLFRLSEAITGSRTLPERFSNGDENPVKLHITNKYPFPAGLTILEELPFQFQIRNHRKKARLGSGKHMEFDYSLRPVERGEYEFGAINVFAESPIGLVRRRFRLSEGQSVPVYPSFLQMRKFELYAISNRLEEIGIKKVRQIGHTLEFDHIREYVQGDDIRSLNWKATARRGGLMVNQFDEEKSQQVFSVLNLGRVMRMPFDGMTLLDYAVNASLVISNIALLKYDKAGLITFDHQIRTYVEPRQQRSHIYRLLEGLYRVETDFYEADLERLYVYMRTRVKKRSLVLLFNNFETLSSMRRQLPYLRRIARDHLLVTIFFENTELKDLLTSRPEKVSDIYLKTIGEKFAFEKREIVREMNKLGIHTILTSPENLTVDTINKYLEIKARGLI